MTVDEIISACGGREEMKKRLGASRTALYNWRHDGIPSRLWPDVVALAAEHGQHAVTFDALKATSRSTRQTVSAA